jgi:hypothetical protein
VETVDWVAERSEVRLTWERQGDIRTRCNHTVRTPGWRLHPRE